MGGKGRGFLPGTFGGTAMGYLLKKKKNNKGQNLIEYALVAAVISAVVVFMSTYVFRSIQATQQEVQKGFRNR